MQCCVKEVPDGVILTHQQAGTLREIVANLVYQDTMNIRPKAFDGWFRGKKAIPVGLRRQLNGRYRVFMHEKVTQVPVSSLHRDEMVGVLKGCISQI